MKQSKFYRVIGLTGGVATGKSTASSILKKLGAEIIDADQIAREVVRRGSEGYRRVVEAFGRGILTSDGEIDRKGLRKEVFEDPKKRENLDRIIHPLIKERIFEEVSRAIGMGKKVIVVDAALLIETGSYRNFDGLILVYAGRETQLKRLMERDGIGKEEAEKVVSSQMDIEEKRRFATYIIDNNGSIGETERQIVELYSKIVGEMIDDQSLPVR